jgi:N-acetylglucosaminyl-diphospho-decaprenol L-rhamnosyltransferase
MTHVDAVIVSYNSRDTLLAGVEPLLALPGVTVTIVDNASADGSLDVLDGLPVRAIQSGRNGGFGFGCNLGMAAGDAPYVLFLNPDARIERDDLDRLVAVLDAEPQVAVVAPRLLDGTGELIPNLRSGQRASSIWAQAFFLHRVLPRARWANEIDRRAAAHDAIAYPEWVSGACMLARREMLERIGGFDEGFFLYGEDMDLCARLRAAGGRVRHEPGATVRHEGGQSAPRTSLYAVLAQSRARYARKHSGPISARLVHAGLAAEALTHVIANVWRPANARGHAAALRTMLRRDRASAGFVPAGLGRDAR